MIPVSIPIRVAKAGRVLFLLGFTPAIWAQPAATPEPFKIGAAWDNLLKDTIPQAAVDPILAAPQEPVKKSAAGDFLNHFYFEERTTYEHSDIDFTGLPTNTGIIPGPSSDVFNPNGFAYPPAFLPSSNQISTFLDLGTRGWGSDRIDTHVGVRYRQDLTHVNPESSDADILNTFGSERLLELTQASIEIHSKPTDGFWAGTSLELGRQDIYGAEYAALDGASFKIDKHNVSVTLFGGRRFTYFSDPDQRAIGGGNIVFRLNPKTSVSYETLIYIQNTQKVTVRHTLNDSWQTAAYFRSYGGAPVDANGQVFYQAHDGKTSARVSYFQKLSDRDNFYDYTVAARDLDPSNPLFRLNLNPLKRYRLVAAEGRHSFSSRFSLSAAVAVQRMMDVLEQGDFQTPFQDYRVNAQLVPFRRFGLDLSYHEHDSDRLAPPLPTANTFFDDVSTSGESSVKDLTGELRRTFGEGRLTLSGGAYYRRIGMQDRSFIENGIHQSGWLAGARIKLDDRTRLIIDYSLDNDFFLFRPAISDARILRVGLAWKY